MALALLPDASHPWRGLAKVRQDWLSQSHPSILDGSSFSLVRASGGTLNLRYAAFAPLYDGWRCCPLPLSRFTVCGKPVSDGIAPGEFSTAVMEILVPSQSRYPRTWRHQAEWLLAPLQHYVRYWRWNYLASYVWPCCWEPGPGISDVKADRLQPGTSRRRSHYRKPSQQLLER